MQTWLVLEFCNRGCVADAVSKGWFRKQGSRFEPDLKVILPTAREIAGALSYLHSKNILHGDLTGSNVLLTVTAEGHRGWMAKVGCQHSWDCMRCSGSTVLLPVACDGV